MTATNPLPKLITFDGEARSGKGTIVGRVKDALRDDYGYKVMLIDAGQVFRSLVVAATNRDVDLNNPEAIDTFLSNEESVQACVQFVKAVYHMEKVDRDALLYSSEIGVNSAKIGSRPLSQSFKDMLLEKWLKDARAEGFEIVLLDGRALEEVGIKFEQDGLCEYVLGLYFICDPVVGAMRTLGFAGSSYTDLDDSQKLRVDDLASEIITRNDADKDRSIQPIVPPHGATTFTLPDIIINGHSGGRFMAVVDSSRHMTKDQMSIPVVEAIVTILNH